MGSFQIVRLVRNGAFTFLAVIVMVWLLHLPRAKSSKQDVAEPGTAPRPVRCAEAAEPQIPAFAVSAPVLTAGQLDDAHSSGPESPQVLLRRWAEKEPASAAAWAAQVTGRFRGEALEQVAIAWADLDLRAACQWVGSLPEDSGKEPAVLGVANEAARIDPQTALELAGSLPPSQARDNALVHAISQWTAIDASGAAAWASSVDDSNLRERLVSGIAIATAVQDPATAASQVASLPAGSEQSRAAVAVVQRWALSAPQAAAAWVLLFPDGPVRTAAAENLLAIWAAQDPQAAGQWLQQLPQGPLLQAASSGLAQGLRARGQGPLD